MGSMDDDRSQDPSVNDNELATEETEEVAVELNDQQRDIWAQAEGYTPLADIQYTSLMVSFGPDDDDDDDGDGDGDGDDDMTSNDNTRQFHSLQATDSNIHGVARASIDVVDDFENIADSALSFLDREYHRTLQGKRPTPRWEHNVSTTNQQNNEHGSGEDGKFLDNEQEQNDLKIIAAAFDQRKEEAISTAGSAGASDGFVANWDALEAPSASTTATKSSSPPPSSSSAAASVDTDALRKVVQSLSQKTDRAFQQRFVAWQERQKALPPAHDLIPPTPYKAFRRSTEKAKQATSSLSRSATMAETVVRLREEKLLPRGDSSTTLLIDVVGVDHVECESIQRIQSTFRPFVRWMGAWEHTSWQHIHLRLIGRDLMNAPSAANPVNLLTPQTATRLQSAYATCHNGIYHEWLETGSSVATPKNYSNKGSSTSNPSVVIAYNAGIWGYSEWQPTIQYLAEQSKSSIPIIVTAYTLEECQEDFEVIRGTVESSNGLGKVLWQAEPNPFGSKQRRETKSSTQEYRENSSWQAWLLGVAKTSD